MRTLRPGTDWSRKVQPVFLEVAKANRDFEEGLRELLEKGRRATEALGNPPDADRLSELRLKLDDDANAFAERMDARMDEIISRHGDPPTKSGAFAYLYPQSELSPDREPGPLFRLLHWFRYGKRVEHTTARDAQGDLKAYRALTQTGEDYRRAVLGRGPIHPFKRDEVHRQLLEILSCYEIEPLTAVDLVDCFDEFCACGIETHVEDNLRKQYLRLKDDLNATR